MYQDDRDTNRYSFRIEGTDIPQRENMPAAPIETQSANDQKNLKKWIRRAIALSLVLALLVGGGLGVVINRYVLPGRESDSAAQASEPSAQQEEPETIELPSGSSDTERSLPQEQDAADKPQSESAPKQTQTHRSGSLLYTDSTEKKEMSVADVVEGVESSVVAITVDIESTATYFMQSYNYTTQAKGSGVIISTDGYIVTNNHVVEDATHVYVTLENGENYDAEVIGSDDFTDLGLIKIDATGLTAAQFGDSDAIRKGDQAIVIGNPLGYLDGSVTTGIISAMGRTLDFSDGTTLHNLIQTDAAVNPGNSGGGLFDSHGALIGIICAKNASSDVEGLGFAIPVSTVRTIVEDLSEYGYVKGRPALGITVLEVNNAYTAMYNQLPRLGTYVTGFISSEAESGSELQIGDCIVSINGTEVMTSADVFAAIYSLKVGDTVSVEVLRNSETITVQSTLVEQTADY